MRSTQSNIHWSKNLITCFILSILIGSPFAKSYACTYTNDPAMAQQKEACQQDSSKEWVCEYNRCLYKEEATEARKEYERCEEESDDEARKACHDALAARYAPISNDAEGADSKLYNFTLMLAALNLLAKGGGDDVCISKKVLMAAGIIGILGELYAMYGMEDKVEELREKYSKETAKEKSYDAQMRSFEYLIEEQQAISDTAQTKSTIYSVVTGLYSATTIIAILEGTIGYLWGTPTPCTGSSGEGEGGDSGGDAGSQPADGAAPPADGAAPPAGGGASPPAGGGSAPTGGPGGNSPQPPPSTFNINLRDYPFTMLPEPKIAQGHDTELEKQYFVFKSTTAFHRGELRSPTYEEYEGLVASNFLTTLSENDRNNLSSALTFIQSIPAKTMNLVFSPVYAGEQSNAFISYLLGAGVMAGAFYSVPGFNWINTAMNNSWGVAAIGAFGVYTSNELKKGMDDVMDEANSNIGIVAQAQAKFVESMAGHCPEGRDDLENPSCYCYNSDGTENGNRSNSETCQTLWAANDGSFDYNKDGEFGINSKKSIGCMAVNGQFDARCKCKKIKNSQGQNACFKAPTKLVGGDLPKTGAALGLPSLGATVSKMSNGSLTPAGINGADAARQAAKNLKIMEKKLKENQKQLKKETGIDFKNGPESAEKALAKLLNMDKLKSKVGSGANFNSLAASGRSSLPSGVSENLKKAASRSGLNDKAVYGKSSRRGRSGGKKKKSGLGFDFGGSSEQGISSGEVATFEDAEYDYKGNDITDREDVSIWKIISHRYGVTGLPRLFGDDGPSIEQKKK